MPTYEYECTKCGHTFEAFQSMKDAPLSSCPECRGRVRRLIGGGLGVIFKGSGFYSTDNKKGSVLTGGNGNGKGRTRTSRRTAAATSPPRKRRRSPRTPAARRRRKLPRPDPGRPSLTHTLIVSIPSSASVSSPSASSLFHDASMRAWSGRMRGCTGENSTQQSS